MAEEKSVELEIEIIAKELTEEELDKATRNLLSELRETGVDSASLVSVGKGPEGSKGDPITIGQLALEILPAAIPSVIAMIQAWALRGHGRTVKIRGKGYEFEGSPEEVQKLLDKIEKGRKKK